MPESSITPRSSRSVRAQSRTPRRIAHRSGLTAIAAVALYAVHACGGASDGGGDSSLSALLSVDQLGDGWVASDPGEVALVPGAVAPPCPFEGAIPDIVVTAAESMEFGDEERQLGINHTVVELNDAGAADAVLETWESMDCSDSDATQRRIDGLPDDVFAVELDTIDSDFTQTVLVRVDGSTMSFLVVTGDGAQVLDVTRQLAPLI
jgi:hypothetical protein